MNAFVVFILFSISFRLGSIAAFIHIILHYKPPMSCICYIIICHIFCQHLSRIMFGYCSKYEHSLTPNVLTKSLQLTMIRKIGMHDSPRYSKRMEPKVSPLLLIFSNGNTFWSNEIHSWFLVTSSTCFRCA